MKFLIVSLALVAGVMADVSELGGYDYHAPAGSHDHGAVVGGDFGGDGGYSSSVPSNSYIPPAASAPSNSYIPPAASAPVNSYIPPAASAPANTYIPPAASAPAPSNTYIPPSTGGSADFGDDGYRYKTQRRRVYRQRV